MRETKFSKSDLLHYIRNMSYCFLECVWHSQDETMEDIYEFCLSNYSFDLRAQLRIVESQLNTLLEVLAENQIVSDCVNQNGMFRAPSEVPKLSRYNLIVPVFTMTDDRLDTKSLFGLMSIRDEAIVIPTRCEHSVTVDPAEVATLTSANFDDLGNITICAGGETISLVRVEDSVPLLQPFCYAVPAPDEEAPIPLGNHLIYVGGIPYYKSGGRGLSLCCTSKIAYPLVNKAFAVRDRIKAELDFYKESVDLTAVDNSVSYKILSFQLLLFCCNRVIAQFVYNQLLNEQLESIKLYGSDEATNYVVTFDQFYTTDDTDEHTTQSGGLYDVT